MAAMVTDSKPTALKPRVLVVDDEPGMIELVSDVVNRAGNCRLIIARNIAQARQILNTEKIDLMLTDVGLPDGDGMSLLGSLRERHPLAAAVVITGNPSVGGAVSAMREGVVDFLPKPFSAAHLTERINSALKRQATTARKEIRLSRLKGAVKKLNLTRHTISKKVDLLCNDLVSAYGELSRQLDVVRTQEAFRKLLAEAGDLEQLLCHTMDWILRHAGYSNVAIWLASEDQTFELGAYMKFTIAGEPKLTDAMRRGLIPMISREGSVHLFGPEMQAHLTPAEWEQLAGQEILGANCTYLGESLASVVMFRDDKSPFSDDDVAMIRTISPIFAVALASMVRQAHEDEFEDDTGGLLDDNIEPRRDDKQSKPPKKPDAADWWKRGEPPPF
jgi:FixJ family two-component response regulator